MGTDRLNKWWINGPIKIWQYAKFVMVRESGRVFQCRAVRGIFSVCFWKFVFSYITFHPNFFNLAKSAISSMLFFMHRTIGNKAFLCNYLFPIFYRFSLRTSSRFRRVTTSPIAHFTVVSLVTWPFRCEAPARIDFVCVCFFTNLPAFHGQIMLFFC